MDLTESVAMRRIAVSEVFRHHIRLASLLLLSYLVCPIIAQAREIWLSGMDPVSKHAKQTLGAHDDYMDLFRPQARWSRAAKDLSVFKVPAQFLLFEPAGDLSLVFADLKQRHIALAVEMGFLFGENCGKGLEGYAGPAASMNIARRVHDLGGDLNYVAMDEELHFGHIYDARNSCKFPIAEIARQVAAGIRQMRQFFPKLQVGDIEPIGSVHPREEVDEIMEWAAAYRAAVGEPLAFLDADVRWGQPWKPELRLLAGSLRTAHIAFGIIYDGDVSKTTGQDWTRQVEERFAAIEADPTLVPDRAILQSWMPQPEHMLPETEPGTLTYLVNRYTASPSRISAQRTSAGIAGRLTDGTGNPIVRATVQVVAVANARTDIMVVRKLTGVVPPDAAGATIGLRINGECGCSGPANVAVGAVVYRDDRTGQTTQREFRRPDGAMATVSRFAASAGQGIGQNTLAFPVTPGDPFTTDVPLSASYDSDEHGVITIIFLNQEGKGIGRISLPFQPSTELIGTTITDASGRFVLPLNPALRNSDPSYLAVFVGNEKFRFSSSLTP